MSTSSTEKQKKKKKKDAAAKKKAKSKSISKGGSTPKSKPKPKPTSNTPKPKRKSSNSSRSAFPTTDMSQQVMRQKLNEYETQIKSLTRDNKVLARKIEKMDDNTNKKIKTIDKEKDMRLNANKERYWLRQKLSRLQLAIEARLKMLGIDFSNINDLGEALEAAFAAIQKLAAELAKKEEELQAMKSKWDMTRQELDVTNKNLDKLNRKIKKQKNAHDDLKRQLADKERRLSQVAKQKNNMNDKEIEQQAAIDKLRDELDALRKAKNKQFDEFVDKKAELDKDLRDKDKQMKELKLELENQKKKNSKLQSANDKLREQMEKLQSLLDKTNEKLLEEKDKNKQLQNDNDELQEELDDANKRNKKLKDKNKSLQDELAKLRKQLADALKQLADANKTIADQKDQIDGLQNDLNAANNKIKALETKNAALNDKVDNMTDMMAERDKQIADQAKKLADLEKAKKEKEEEMNAMFEQQKQLAEMLKKKVAGLEKKNKAKDNQLADRDNQLAAMKAQLEAERKAKAELAKQKKDDNKTNTDALDALTSEKNALKEMLDKMKANNTSKDDEIAALKAALDAANKKLNDYLNRPRDDKQTQTDLTGKWIENAKMQLSNIGNIYKENEELRLLATKNDARLGELAEENKILLDEIDTLLKQQAQFRPDTSNHRGEILAMVAAPNTYYAATSATDKSVRLWQIDPNADKLKDQVKPCFRAQMEGVALSLAYTRDGTYLVAGCAYKNGPDGLLIIWNMLKGDGEVEFLFRSRPSVRFGRAHAVEWSNNSQYIFSGDTTGSIWIWDVVNQIQLAEVRSHKDVVHDIGVAGNAMFTCALDQTIAVFDLARLMLSNKKKKKKKKNPDTVQIHVHQPTVYKAKQVNKNDKYPYWLISPTADGSTVIAGSRKLHAWKFSGFKNADDEKRKVEDCDLTPGVRIVDSDLEHVQSLQVSRGLVCICRKEKNRAKIFSTSTGKETYKAKFKGPVKRIQFTFDNANCIVCVQKLDGKKAKPPTMHLWNYKK